MNTTVLENGTMVGENYATICMFSDCLPVEIIKRTVTTLTVREMDASIAFKPIVIPGGFFGHCTNNDQQAWTLISNVNGRTWVAHMRKDGKLHTSLGPLLMGKAVKKHDYNF